MLEPARSGIQRVIKEFANATVHRDFEYRYLSVHENQPKYISALHFNTLIEDFWRNRTRDSSLIQNYFNDNSQRVNLDFDSECTFFRIEPSFNNKVNRFFMELPSNIRCISLVYDTFPATKPQFYSGNNFRPNSYYFRTLLKRQDIITNSNYTKSEVIDQIRNKKSGLGNVVVLPLGGDHVEWKSKPNDFQSIPEIVMIGTLEERKFHKVAFDSIRKLNQFGIKYKLTFIGAESPHNSGFMETIRDADYSWFSLLSNLDDAEIHERLENANVLLQLGEEGFGIHVFEAWEKACLVIFGGRQPAGELLESKGALKLPDISEESVIEKFEWLSVNNYQALRKAIYKMDRSPLPTWNEFINEFETIVSRSQNPANKI